MLFHKHTKLTGLISALLERFAINSGIWSETDDLKIVYFDVTSSAGSGAVINESMGVLSAVREAAGVVTITIDGTWDSIPAAFVDAISDGDITAADRPQACLSDGVAANRYRTTSKQAFLRFDAAVALEDGRIVGFLIGVDANTTAITDNNDSTSLTAASLNRIVAIGDYETPLTEDVVAMLSLAYTATTVNAGDTISLDLANLADADHVRNAAGDYTTTYDDAYVDVVSMMPLVSAITNDALQAGSGDSTTTAVTVYITNGVNDTEVDGNYCVLVLGMAEVA